MSLVSGTLQKGIENSGPQNLQIAIDQEPVSKIKHFRYLGIEVDQFLSWEGHISAFIRTISSGIGIVQRMIKLIICSHCPIFIAKFDYMKYSRHDVSVE